MDWAVVTHGVRVAFVVAAMKRLEERRVLARRVAELLAVATVCERRRLRDLQALEAALKLEQLRWHGGKLQ